MISGDCIHNTSSMPAVTSSRVLAHHTIPTAVRKGLTRDPARLFPCTKFTVDHTSDTNTSIVLCQGRAVRLLDCWTGTAPLTTPNKTQQLSGLQFWYRIPGSKNGRPLQFRIDKGYNTHGYIAQIVAEVYHLEFSDGHVRFDINSLWITGFRWCDDEELWIPVLYSQNKDLMLS